MAEKVVLGIRACRIGNLTEVVPEGFVTGGPVTLWNYPLAGPQRATAGIRATVPPTPHPSAYAGPAPLRGFMDLFYFRVWPIPPILDAQNPRIGSPIPFQLWSAFLEPNTVEGITGTGAEGLDLSLQVGDVFDTLELKTATITLTPDAPFQVDATFNFDFTFGATRLRFLALLADILPIEANAGIVETYNWKTDILPNTDGSEQRISIRTRPRRSLDIQLDLMDDADRKALYDKLYKVAALNIIVPTYQYQSVLKRDTVIGDNHIYCNPKRADLRVGEDLVLLDRDGNFFFYRIQTVNADNVVITTALSQVIKKRGAKVVGGFAGRLPNNTALSMRSKSGNASIHVDFINPRTQLAYPDYPIALPLLDGLVMLLRRPLATEAQESFDSGIEIIDNETGIPSQYTSWDQRYVFGPRQYLINSYFDKDELQFWRTFLDYCRGQQRTFLTPTYRSDLVQAPGTPLLGSQVEVVGSEYVTQYFPVGTYRWIQIELDDGTTHETRVSAVESHGATSSISFDAEIGGDLTGRSASRISYMLLSRLGSDTVTLTHDNTFSTLDLNLRAVKA